MTSLFTFLALSFYCIYAQYSSPGCGKKQPDDNGSTKTYFFANQGYNRSYIVHIPIKYTQNNQTGQPFVIALHGYTDTASDMEATFGLTQKSDTENFVAVYLQSTYFKDPDSDWQVASWNDGDCGLSPGPEGPTCDPYSIQPVPRPKQCDDPDGNQCNWCNCLVNDVEAIEELAQIIENTYCIDMSREYVTGFSQGAMLVHRVACESADRFAAATPFHGQQHLGFDCQPNSTSITMPLMNVWGTEDEEVPGQTVLSQDGWYYIPVSNVQEKFAVHNGCDLSGGVVPIKTVADGYQSWKCIGWNVNCTNNAYTQACSWHGFHEYPIQGKTYFGVNAMWQYMSQFKRIPPKAQL